MLKINPQYLVDDKGEKTAVLLTIKEFQLLMQRLEDLEDTLEMDAAVKTQTEFRDYQDIRTEIMRERTCEPMGIYYGKGGFGGT